MYFLSIDNGLTTTRAVIFSAEGEERGSCRVKTRVENRGDFAEIDMEEQWQNTAAAIRGCLKASGISPELITGVGSSGHGAGLYLLGENGRPLRRAISSMDGRASGLIAQWREEGLTEYYYQKTYQQMWNGQPIPLLYWLKENEPASYAGIRWVLSAKDWIKYRLTGEVSAEITDASCSGLLDLETGRYEPGLLNRFHLGEMYDKLPELTRSTDISGCINRQAAAETGLKDGTPVVGGLFDVVASALGSGVYNEELYSITAGTWNINSAVAESPVKSRELMMWSLFLDGGKYIGIDSSATSAVNLEWFINKIIKGFGGVNRGPEGVELTEPEIFSRIEREISRIDSQHFKIIYLPFLYKSRLTVNLSGGFLGINASDNIYHLLRAVYEGVGFAHLKHLQNLRKSGIERERASLSGGAARSEFWCQLFADILEMEIITTEAQEAGALGTAICTALGLKRFKDSAEAAASMVRDKKRYYPDVETGKELRERYQRFSEIISLLDH